MNVKKMRIRTLFTLTIPMLIAFVILWPACSNITESEKTVKVLTKEPIRYSLLLEKTGSLKLDVSSKYAPEFGRVSEIMDEIFILFPFYEGRSTLILVYTKELKSVGRYLISYGEGPGEAISPRIIGGDREGICVFAAMKNKFMFFSPDFRLLREVKGYDMGTPFRGMTRYVASPNIVVDCASRLKSSTSYRNAVYIRELSAGGIISGHSIFETEKTAYAPDKKIILGDPVHVGVYFNAVYILEKREYKLYKMDFKGRPIKTVRMAFEDKRFSEGERSKWADYVTMTNSGIGKSIMPEKLWPAAWIMKVGNGLAVARCGDYDTSKEIAVIPADYYDEDLNYLGQIELPKVSSWNHPSTGPLIVDTHYFCTADQWFVIGYNKEADLFQVEKYNAKIKTKTKTAHTQN